MKQQPLVVDELLYNNSWHKNILNGLYGVTSKTWSLNRRTNKFIMLLLLQHKLNMSQHIVIKDTAKFKQYLADNNIEHIKISKKVYNAYTIRTEINRDVLVVKYLFGDIKNWLLLIDTKNKLILFYNIENKKENFWSDDINLKKYIEEEMLRDIINKL